MTNSLILFARGIARSMLGWQEGGGRPYGIGPIALYMP